MPYTWLLPVSLYALHKPPQAPSVAPINRGPLSPHVYQLTISVAALILEGACQPFTGIHMPLCNL